MNLAYRRHFPADWDDEKILHYVTGIVNDPGSLWRQLTGKERRFYRPHKFLVDGVREGMRIRVVVEPKSDDFPNAKGILTAYPLH